MKVNFVLTGLLQHYHDLSKVIVSLKTTILTTKPLYTKGRFRKDLPINCGDIMTPIEKFRPILNVILLKIEIQPKGTQKLTVSSRTSGYQIFQPGGCSIHWNQDP